MSVRLLYVIPAGFPCIRVQISYTIMLNKTPWQIWRRLCCSRYGADFLEFIYGDQNRDLDVILDSFIGLRVVRVWRYFMINLAMLIVVPGEL